MANVNALHAVLTNLAAATPLAANLAAHGGESPIAKPIDRGAEHLLQPFVNSYIEYPPLEVDYLIATLNEHLYNCLEVRQKAQKLEVRAFTEASEQVLQRKMIDALERQFEIFAAHEPSLLGNAVDAKVENGVVKSAPSTYWAQVLTEQKAQLERRRQDADARLKRLGEEGHGSNYVARFAFLKSLFDLDLVQAYCRARSAAVGLRAIYGIDLPVPAVTDVGYLDKLVLWARNATYTLEKKHFAIRETTVTFALHDANNNEDVPRLMTVDAFRNARASGTFTFTIPETVFSRVNLTLKNPRLRGLDVNVYVNKTVDYMDYWRLRVEPPEQKLELGGGFPPLDYEPRIYVPMATYPRYVAESSEVPNAREVQNVSPIGEWTIRIEPRSIIGSGTHNNDVVDNLLLRMRIAYERK